MTTLGNDAPPAYPALNGGGDAPPAYAPSYEAENAPPVAQQPSADPAAAPVYAQGQMPMTSMLSGGGGSVPAAGVAGGQAQVMYVQQPMQGQVMYANVNGQMMMVMPQQPQAMQGQMVATVAANPGLSSVAPGTTAVTTNGGEAQPGTVVTTVQTVQRVRPEVPFNRKTVSWAMLLIVILYICQCYATAADQLVVYEYDDDGSYWSSLSVTIYYAHDEYRAYFDWAGSVTVTYSEACDEDDSEYSDDFCDLEGSGNGFYALLVINLIVGIVLVCLVGNVLGKCFVGCCGESDESYKRQLAASKICAVSLSLLSLIALIVWESGTSICDDLHGDDDGDCTWGSTSIVNLVCMIGYVIVIVLLQIKKPGQ